MIKFTWHNDEVPNGMKIKQVHAVLFTQDGRILLQSKIREGHLVYTLSGGRPEKNETDLVSTLKRECIEEINTTIEDDVSYLGYQEVDEDNGKPPYAQVRMMATIKHIGKPHPDPDGGETYTRILTTPQKAIELLDWGEIGEYVITKANQMFLTTHQNAEICQTQQTI